jgi:hypothetical protein
VRQAHCTLATAWAGKPRPRKNAYPSAAMHEITQVPPQIFHNRTALSSFRGGFVGDIK